MLTTVGLSSETGFNLTDKKVSIKSSSLSGENHQVVPVSGISSTHCGYSKPIIYLIIGSIIVLVSILSIFDSDPSWGIVVSGLIIGGILLTLYYLSKKIYIAIETRGGVVLSISFKRSVIENVSVEMDQALQVINIINKRALESQTK